MKQWNAVLQCRAQSAQVKVFHQCRTCCYKFDSFAHGLRLLWRDDQLTERNIIVLIKKALICATCATRRAAD